MQELDAILIGKCGYIDTDLSSCSAQCNTYRIGGNCGAESCAGANSNKLMIMCNGNAIT